MALKKEVNNKKIYVRVDRVICGKLVQMPDFIVGFYEEEQNENGVELIQKGKQHLHITQTDSSFVLFTPETLSSEGNNPLKAAYEYLKTLPQFFDFEDC